ncbi:3-deoxy-7-phosphoheptulonate synthase [Saccharothrix longispora]|uniref:3-deoxy-7-phosphoheptulonate synthase n=1 Tax=Saccharothrix longispora TaxID=33920 RepID=UPI0028FD2EE1|nr:3-deoxy-7-phosphoheptulonate synthase [Saccharothrix longispora]MDU0293762.1 3-deoxy-7-phosphoheptulonate synthase [Saccharothrix longispora]
MVIVTSPSATEAEIRAVVECVERAGGEAFVSRGVRQVVIGLLGDVERFAGLNLGRMPGVNRVMRITSSYKLVSREHHPERTVVEVAGVPIGAGTVTVIAGPCAVESPEQTLDAAKLAIRSGATLLRGGAFKPRTSPYAFQGLGLRGLQILAEVRAETGLPVVTEVISADDVDMVAEHADMLQVGARNMQNFALLQAVGRSGKPVLLKRGMNATIEEWLLAAEYIAQRGNLDIVLCERGIRTFERATRNTLDVSAVPVVQYLSHLPVIIDPSHSGGRRELVLPLSRAGVVAGADGIIIDVHPDPATALCDGPQALIAEDIDEMARSMAELAAFMGRTLLRHPIVRVVGGDRRIV